MIEALIASALRSIVLATIVWLGLKAWRLRNPHVKLTVWTFVLVASLLMPATTRLAAVVVPPAPVIEPIVEDALPLFAESRAPQGAAVSAHSDERPASMVSDAATPPAAGFGELGRGEIAELGVRAARGRAADGEHFIDARVEQTLSQHALTDHPRRAEHDHSHSPPP